MVVIKALELKSNIFHETAFKNEGRFVKVAVRAITACH